MSNFTDENHAFLAGMIIGHLSAAGVSAKPSVDRHGDYTPVMAIDVQLDEDSGTFIPVYIRVLASAE